MKNNVYKRFLDNLKNGEGEEDIVKALYSFIKYLGFEDFEKSDIAYFYETLSTEVYGFDDRRVFISVFYEKNSVVKCRYVITDNKCNTLDNVVFIHDKTTNEWTEVEEY